MYQIIPTILVQDRLEFERRLGIMQGHIPMAQMDIMDGKFVGNTTFTDPKIAARYKVDYELDLMVADPMPYILKWRMVRTVKRAFVHAEIKKPLAPILEKIRALGWKANVSINPDTPWEVVEPFVNPPSPLTFIAPHPNPLPRGSKTGRASAGPGEGDWLGGKNAGNYPSPSGRGQGEGGVGGEALVDCILFMTVYPGQNAAPFQPKVIAKIRAFHVAYPNVPIAVDGGVNEKTLPLLLKAGATRFAVGSAIWSAPDPFLAYKKLSKVAGKYDANIQISSQSTNRE